MPQIQATKNDPASLHSLNRITQRFRSSVSWRPADWQQPLDALAQRLNKQAFVLGSFPDSPIELTPDQWAILHSAEPHLKAAREANDMPRYRRIIEQYEQRAMEFLARNAADRNSQQQQPTN